MKRHLLTFFFSYLLIGSVHAQLDTNNNGMSDIWERHFNDGELFPPGILAEGDEDGDGQSNLAESLAGTDPFEISIPDGYFKADVRHVPETWYQGPNDPEPTLGNPEAYEISWYGLAGKQYILQGSADLQNWMDITTRNGYGYLITEACFPQDENDEPFPRFFWRVKVEDVIAEDGVLTQYERELLGMVGDWDENFPGISPVWLATYFGKEILANGLYSINPNDDADGDGLTNLEEGMQGTNPNVADPPGSNSGQAQWVIAVGDSMPGNPIERTRTFTLEPEQGALLVTAIASTEFDYYTDPERESPWNDKLSWKISYPGNAGQTQTINVNDRHTEWLLDRQMGTSVPGLPSPAHLEEVKTVYNDGSAAVNVEVTVSAENITDGNLPSTITVGFLPVEFITPSGDPVGAPKAAGNDPENTPDGANEFTFTDAATGKLTINLKAKIPKLNLLYASQVANIKFDLDKVGNSTLKWDAANAQGAVSTDGEYITAKAVYEKLPVKNSDFGLKNARIRFDNEKVGESKFEVFFPRDAKNHPGNNSNEPNWFYYWKDHINSNYTLVYGGAGPGNGTAAEVKAMTEWSYTLAKDKQIMTIYDTTLGKFKAYGVGKEYSGIDSFFSTVIHESKHCDQISSADQLVATGTNGPWKNGWSFNVGNLHNHWSVGKDKKPGVANVDDDMDGNVDNLLATGPGELGYGDDIDLTHPTTNSRNWPAVWTPPENLLVPSEIETEAIQASNQQHDEHDEARNDWGDPGKNHKTIDAWDD